MTHQAAERQRRHVAIGLDTLLTRPGGATIRRGTLGRDRTRDLATQAHFLQQLFRQLTQEARRSLEGLLAVHAPQLGVGQVEALHGAGDTDVAQATLFLEAPRLLQ